jgi:protoheme IX farnesyltransferase
MRDYIELTKPRITCLTVICTGVGCYFGGHDSWSVVLLIHALLGTALMASGTAALNQWYEADIDSKMLRTRARPISAWRVKPHHALLFGLTVSAAGFADLWLGANALATGLGLFTLLTYLLVYTPLKPRSPICTTVGARRDASRDRMLPVVQSDGHATARRIVLCCLLLVPVSLIPNLLGITGSVYSLGAAGLGGAFVYYGVRLARNRTLIWARQVLIASVLCLPALLTLMVVDRP